MSGRLVESADFAASASADLAVSILYTQSCSVFASGQRCCVRPLSPDLTSNVGGPASDFFLSSRL